MTEQAMLRGWWVHRTHKLTRVRKDRTKDTWTSSNKEKLYRIAAEKLAHDVCWELELTDRFTGRREFLRVDTIDGYRAEHMAAAYAA